MKHFEMRYFDSKFSKMNSNDIEAELTPGLWWITPRVEIMNLVKGVALKIILFCQQFRVKIRQQFSHFHFSSPFPIRNPGLVNRLGRPESAFVGLRRTILDWKTF